MQVGGERFSFVLFLESHRKKHGGRKGEQTQWGFMPNQVLGVRILRFNGQDQKVRSGIYCCSSIRVASIDENKNTAIERLPMTHTQTPCSNHIALRAGKKGTYPADGGALASVFEK